MRIMTFSGDCFVIKAIDEAFPSPQHEHIRDRLSHCLIKRIKNNSDKRIFDLIVLDSRQEQVYEKIAEVAENFRDLPGYGEVPILIIRYTYQQELKVGPAVYHFAREQDLIHPKDLVRVVQAIFTKAA